MPGDGLRGRRHSFLPAVDRPGNPVWRNQRGFLVDGFLDQETGEMLPMRRNYGIVQSHGINPL